ncbi:MAG: GtrA family protein [Rhodospirillaceae bacterium]
MTVATVKRLAATRLGRLGLQFGKFGMVGVVGFVVDVAVLYLMLAVTAFGPYGSRVVSFLVAATTTWALNRCFTFRGAHDGTALRQWARFIVANAFGGVINYTTFVLLVAGTVIVAAHPFLGVAAGSIAGMFFNFAASKKLVFRTV